MGKGEDGRFRVLSVDDVEPLAVGHDLMVPLRRLLGVQAFGINAFVGRQPGDTVVGVHDELGGYAAGHEEAYLVVRGRATVTADGKSFDAPPGTILFAQDPAVKRGVVAAEPDTVVIVLGGAAGEAYRPGAWEYGYVAAGLASREDWAGADEALAEGLIAYPKSAQLWYNRACFAALSGSSETALEHLAEALRHDPDTVREWGAEDSDLDVLRGDPRFPL
ncbi:MAG: TPR end-of-group domain-containing protein [Gaiella sp.]